MNQNEHKQSSHNGLTAHLCQHNNCGVKCTLSVVKWLWTITGVCIHCVSDICAMTTNATILIHPSIDTHPFTHKHDYPSCTKQMRNIDTQQLLKTTQSNFQSTFPISSLFQPSPNTHHKHLFQYRAHNMQRNTRLCL